MKWKRQTGRFQNGFDLVAGKTFIVGHVVYNGMRSKNAPESETYRAWNRITGKEEFFPDEASGRIWLQNGVTRAIKALNGFLDEGFS